MKSYQQFFAELKRRRVFRVMAVYGATAFVVLQVADLLAQGMGLSDQVLRVTTFLVLVGFPIAIVLAWAFDSTPEGVRRTADATPEEISEILAQPVARRWASGLLALAGVALLFGGGWWIGRRTAPAPAATASSETAMASGLRLVDLSDDVRPSIAVLPFVDMSSTQDQEYFGDGMTDAILNVLARAGEMRVAGRTSAFAYKSKDRDLREIGTELGVAYLVEGSVAKEGDQVRITAQLIDAADNSHLWSDQYFRPLTSIFEVQSEISAAIANALKVPLGLDRAADFVRPTGDLEAYDLYLAGRASLRDRPRVGEAIRLFEAAIARDSTWAPAWAGLAEAIEVSTWYSFSWDEGPPENSAERLAGERQRQQAAEVAALRALELDPSVASAHVALGSVYRYRNEWDRSEAEYLQALDADPDNAEALQQYAEMVGYRGRIAEAVRMAERARVLDPTPVKYLLLASLLHADGRPEESLARVNEGMDLYFPDARSNFYSGNWYYIHLEAGRYEQMLEHALPRYIEAGDSILQALAARDPSLMPDDLVDPTFLMVVGQPDAAAELMLEFIGKHPGQPGYIWDPVFDPIRDHPAMQEALGLVNLAGVSPQRTAP